MLIRTTDQAAPQSAFQSTRRLTLFYERSLRKIARQIGDLTDLFDPGGDQGISPLVSALQRYERLLAPWAETTAARMLADVNRVNGLHWKQYSEQMGVELRRELENADTGRVMRQLQAEQVELITSLPRDAAERAQKIASESLISGARFTELRDELMKTGEVTKSRATLIARTETSKASSLLTQARAQAIGSTGYIWRSHRDNRTRPSHREMNGRFVAWDSPPTLDGLTGHAGCVPNCRCFARPVLPGA